MPWFAIVPATAVVAVIASVFVWLIARGLQADAAAIAAVANAAAARQLLTSILLSMAVITLGTLIALPAALATAAWRLPARRVWTVALAMPLAVPGYALALAWLGLAAPGGPMGAMAGWMPRPSGFAGAALLLALNTYPYLFLALHTTVTTRDPALTEAARALGHRPLSVFLRVTVPILLPSWLAGSLLVTLHVLGDFAITGLLRVDTMAARLYLNFTAGADRSLLALHALLLVLLALAILVVAWMALGHRTRHRAESAPARAAARPSLGVFVLPAMAVLALPVLMGVVAPIASLVWWMQAGWTNLDTGAVLSAAGRSSLAAAMAAVIAAAFAVPLAWLGARRPTIGRWCEGVVFAGYAVPPLALALAVVAAVLALAPAAYQTLPLLAGALAIHFMAEVLGPVRARWQAIPPRLAEAGAALGAAPAAVLRRIDVPLIRGAIGAGAALTFISVLKELPLTLILAPIGFETLAMNAWTYTNEALYAEAAPHAMALVGVSAVATAVLTTRSIRR